MPRNIEIKASVQDFARLKVLAAELSGTTGQVLVQTDTFFHSKTGRLKLRSVESQKDGTICQLIYYCRPNQNGPKTSTYSIVKLDNDQEMKSVLSTSNGVRGVVRKTRLLYLVGQTRIHLDQVDQLGDFMELEVVLRDDQTEEEGQQIAQNLMSELQIDPQNLIEGAYLDMLLNRGEG